MQVIYPLHAPCMPRAYPLLAPCTLLAFNTLASGSPLALPSAYLKDNFGLTSARSLQPQDQAARDQACCMGTPIAIASGTSSNLPLCTSKIRP